jgi:hypothetical protein
MISGNASRADLARMRKEYPAMLALQERTQAALNNVAVATEVDSAECFLDQRATTHSESNSCECRLPEVPEAREKRRGMRNHLTNWRFISTRSLRLEADLKQMRVFRGKDNLKGSASIADGRSFGGNESMIKTLMALTGGS